MKRGLELLPLLEVPEESSEPHTVVELQSDDEEKDDEEEDLRTSRWLKRSLNTRLIAAILDSNPDEVERLLTCNASPVARCQDSMATVLHIAALRGEKRILCSLLKEARKLGKLASAIRARDKHGRMPQHLATAAGKIATLKVLLEEDPSLIDVQANTDDLNSELSSVPAVELDSYLHTHKDVTELLLPVTPGSTVLHIAAKHSFIDIADYLTSQKARMDIMDKDGLNPLDVAGLYSDPTVPGTIISAATPALLSPEVAEDTPKDFVVVPFTGTGLKRRRSKSTKMSPPILISGATTVSIFQNLLKEGARVSQLHIYVEQYNIDMIKEILNGPEEEVKILINRYDNKARTPVHLAVELSLLEPLKLLLEKDSSSILKGDSQDRTPLHIAVEKEWAEGIELILQYKPNMQAKSVRGDTVLHIVARKKNLVILSALLECANKTDLEEINNAGYTPLLLAIESGDVPCFQEMIDFNKSVLKSHIDSQDKHYNSDSLAHAAVKANAVQILKLLRIKLENGFKEELFNTYNGNGLTPLHLTVVLNSTLCLDELLNFSGIASTRLDDRHEGLAGGTAIHLAAKLGRLSALQTILQHHNSQGLIRAADNDGREPLIIAAFYGNSECVSELLQNGANLAARDKTTYKTAIDHIYYNVPNCVSLLDKLLDASIQKSHHREDSKDLQLTLNYKLLLADKNEQGRQLGIIDAFIKCRHEAFRHKFFLHPLTESFLFFKWNKLKRLYYIMISLFLYHIFLLTGLSLTKYAYELPDCAFTFRILMLILGVPILLLEVLNFRLDQTYVLDAESWMKWSVIGGTVVVGLLDELPWHRYATSITLLLSWGNLLFLFARIPKWVEVLMFFEVAVNVFQVLSTFVFLFLGFAFAFFILFNGSYPFTSLGATLSKVLIMMVELDYNGVFSEEDIPLPIAVLGRILYLGFVVLVVMVLTNLMVGLAVTDITQLQNQGKSKRMEKKAQFAVLFERICYRNRFFRSYIAVVDSISVWPNKKAKTQENPLPAEVVSSIMEAALNRDEQADLDSLNEKVDNLIRDVRQIFRMVKHNNRRNIKGNNSI